MTCCSARKTNFIKEDREKTKIDVLLFVNDWDSTSTLRLSVDDGSYYFYYQSFSYRAYTSGSRREYGAKRRMGVYVTGVIGVIVFYVAVLAVGIWAAAFKRRQVAQGHFQADMMLANRRLGPLLGVFTLIGNHPQPGKKRILHRFVIIKFHFGKTCFVSVEVF